MAEAYRGLIAEMKDEAERNIIMRMLNDHSLEEVAKFSKMTSSEILNKIKKVD